MKHNHTILVSSSPDSAQMVPKTAFLVEGGGGGEKCSRMKQNLGQTRATLPIATAKQLTFSFLVRRCVRNNDNASADAE